MKMRKVYNVNNDDDGQLTNFDQKSSLGSGELKKHDRFILRKLIKKYESNHRIFTARVINVQCPQTCRRQATCSSSLFCRIRACSASQLEVVDPVPKPVPLAQYCWDFSSVWVCTGTLAGVFADCMADRISWAFKIKNIDIAFGFHNTLFTYPHFLGNKV